MHECYMMILMVAKMMVACAVVKPKPLGASIIIAFLETQKL